MELMGPFFVGIVYQASMRVAQFRSCHWFHSDDRYLVASEEA